MKRFLILLLFVAAIGIAQAQVKFHLGSPSPLRTEQNDIQKIQSSLGAMVLRSGKVILSRAEQVPQAIQEAEILSIQLFDDVYAEALQKETRLTPSGALYWIGDLTGNRQGVMEWLWSNGYLTGSINDYSTGKIYDITSDAQGAIRITELDKSLNPQPDEDCFDHEEDPEAFSENEDSPLRASATAANPAQIDILIIYPSPIAEILGRSEPERKAKIEAIIEQTNQIFTNSEIYVRFRLAGHEINDNVPAAASSSDDVATTEEVKTLRNKYGADIVSHWNYNGSAGSAYIGFTPGNGSGSNLGFNTSNYNDVISRYTFAHECGHNLGARHDRYDYVGKPAIMEAPGYQFGKCFLTYRTVMAYSNSNKLPGYSSSKDIGRIMHYSNPNVLYAGVPTGIAGTSPSAEGDGGPADVALRINECAKTVENWVAAKTPTYYTLTVNNGEGGGQYTNGAWTYIYAGDAPAGKEFDQWTGDVSMVADRYATKTTIVMGSANATVTASYKNLSQGMFTLTVNNGSGSGNYATGDVVTIAGNRAPSGQVFSQWTGDVAGVTDIYARTTTFTMGASNAVLTPTYTNNTPVEEVSTGRLNLYLRDAVLTIDADASIQSVTLYSLTGMKLRSVSPDSSTATLAGIPQGVSIVKIVLQNGKTVTRKIVFN